MSGAHPADGPRARPTGSADLRQPSTGFDDARSPATALGDAPSRLTPPRIPFSIHEERIALADLGLELVGREIPDPRTLAHLGLRGPAPARWEDVLFLDTETTGLSGGTGTYVFLLGTARIEDDTLVLRQHLLHDLAAERAFVAALAAELAPYRACVSYNGKCFDLPLLRARFVLARGGAELAVDDSHLDLLHPARRLWRGRFGSVTLRQLEDSVLDNGARENDIAGALIPARFFAWLRSGDDALIAPILTHNSRDVVSLIRITDRIASAITRARAGHAPDHAPAALSLARAFARAGEVEAAFCCWESAYRNGDLVTRRRAALPYARAIERRGDRGHARQLIETLLDLGQGTPRWREQAEARLRRLDRSRRRPQRASVPRPPP